VVSKTLIYIFVYIFEFDSTKHASLSSLSMKKDCGSEETRTGSQYCWY